MAEILGVTEAQVRNMRARGQLPHTSKRPGLGVVWPAPVIADFVAHGLPPAPLRRAPHPPPTRAPRSAAPGERDTPMRRHQRRLVETLGLGLGSDADTEPKP